jgi:hypothetical protein
MTTDLTDWPWSDWMRNVREVQVSSLTVAVARRALPTRYFCLATVPAGLLLAYHTVHGPERHIAIVLMSTSLYLALVRIMTARL